MRELKNLAKRLLEEGTVKVVIGYEEGPVGVRPVFVTRPADAEKLVFNSKCVQNLAAYLSRRRGHIARLGKPAIVVKGCDARAVAGLIRESQLKREDVVMIGIRCGGVSLQPSEEGPLTPATVADRCGGCESREPKLADHLLGALPPAPPKATRMSELMAQIEKMPVAERFRFWAEQFERCVRCNACREVCPMCFCERCIQDKSQPQWIETSPHARGNLSWHFTHAMHLAGRCSSCDECQRACPAGLPLGLLNRKMAEIVRNRFEYQVSDDSTVPSPIGAFKQQDPQEFIK